MNYPLVCDKSKAFHLEINGKRAGRDFLLIAGPCSVESEAQITQCARIAHEAGADILRGGVFKPRESPYSFQGLGFEGLKMLHGAAKMYQLPIVSEVVDTRDVEKMAQYCDILQIGARNMQNYALLTEAAKSQRIILLKRGMNATIEEFLGAAEYIALAGNEKIILCERGIACRDSQTRNCLDLASVPVLKSLTHLPVFVDPSHATGRRDLIEPMSLAAVMCGADGLEIEVHPEPDKALSDAAQQLGEEAFRRISKKIRACVSFRDQSLI